MAPAVDVSSSGLTNASPGRLLLACGATASRQEVREANEQTFGASLSLSRGLAAKHEILSLVRGLKVTTVAALHDLNLAATYCDRIYVMQDGRVVASGPPADVLTTDLVEAVFSVRLRRWQDLDDGRLHLTFDRIAPVPEAGDVA